MRRKMRRNELRRKLMMRLKMEMVGRRERGPKRLERGLERGE
jgi:hypothetical protein